MGGAGMRTASFFGRESRRLLVALTGASLLLSSSALIVDAATTSKTYTATGSVGPLFAGGTYQTGVQYNNLQITLANTTTPQAIGSANFIVPTGITLLNPSTGQPAVVDDPTACFN